MITALISLSSSTKSKSKTASKTTRGAYLDNRTYQIIPQQQVESKKKKQGGYVVYYDLFRESVFCEFLLVYRLMS
jgi:hypothetical protein